MKKALLRHVLPSLIGIACLASSIPAFAGDPIPGLDVKLGKPGGGGKAIIVKTDEDGMFTFDNLSEGTYTLTISYAACKMAINTKGTGAQRTMASEPKFSLVCDDGNGITVGDLDGDGALDRTASSGDVKAPRDLATGQASGKRQHKPITITKDWSNTPELTVVISGGKKEFKGHVTLMK